MAETRCFQVESQGLEWVMLMDLCKDDEKKVNGYWLIHLKAYWPDVTKYPIKVGIDVSLGLCWRWYAHAWLLDGVSFNGWLRFPCIWCLWCFPWDSFDAPKFWIEIPMMSKGVEEDVMMYQVALYNWASYLRPLDAISTLMSWFLHLWWVHHV